MVTFTYAGIILACAIGSDFLLLLTVGIALGTIAWVHSKGAGPNNMAILLFFFGFTIINFRHFTKCLQYFIGLIRRTSYGYFKI